MNQHDRVMNVLNRMIIEIDEALIKAKAQMEYLDDREIDLMKLGYEAVSYTHLTLPTICSV